MKIMTKDEMLALVEKQLANYNKRDLDAFCSCYHSDVKVELLISGKISILGMIAFRDCYANLFSSNPELKCDLKTRIILESSIIDEEYVTGASNFPNGLHATAIYGFRDGLIDRVWFPR